MDSDFTMAIKQEIALANFDDRTLDWREATDNTAQRWPRHQPSCLSVEESTVTHASFAEAATTSRARSQARIPDAIAPARDFHPRSLAPLTLFVTWYQRACFRAELLADLRDRPEYLNDIGICRHEATSETTRFFWEPILLRPS
ncbi:hypothetical protein [Bradyrhizobium sp. 21]|uniref:hypothetical protein n=1 Tax=Bradyrhizobium sp. 21 TaxID=2782666 RepID=UPI001FFC1634|nr:hypothetical protein [Bradyrhizobium sp. 21]MCK1387762.1 hypothetical protein [Bradyrhizobium sp. 21]